MHSGVRLRTLSEGRNSVGGWLCRSGSCHTTWRWSEGPFLGGRFVSWPRLADSGTVSGSEHSYGEKVREWPERWQKGPQQELRERRVRGPQPGVPAVTGPPVTGEGVAWTAFRSAPFSLCLRVRVDN